MQPAAAMNDIIIYAELLSNIRQVSVAVSIPSPLDATTSAEVDGLILRITHQGQTQALTLPALVSKDPGQLPLPASSISRLNWRLPISMSAANTLSFSPENQPLPWNSTDLQIGSSIYCRSCRHAIVEAGVIKEWKDLPSENWAEMMEFWHCHKPHDHDHGHDNHENLEKRGYGASNLIAAQRGIGFVDISSFSLLESDCTGLSVSC
jgi:ubiquitin-protein ligase E3 D